MNGRLMDDITNFIFMDDIPQKADIIFLPGGSYPEQAEYAAHLYQEGYADIILPSGGVSIKTGKFNGVKSKQDIYYKEYKTEYEFLTDVLLMCGVPKSAIFEENQAGHTRDNAYMSRQIVDQKQFEVKKAIVVCKTFHARRCYMLYQLAFPESEIIICPFESDNMINRNNWSLTERGIDSVFGEVARCGNQFLGDIKKGIISEENHV